MKLIIDSTEIFSFFNRTSKARQLTLSTKLYLHSPEYSLNEIKEHKTKILESFGLSIEQFSLIEKLLMSVIKFEKVESYSLFIPKAKEISPDPDDVDFIALALKMKCPIWSSDKLLKQQKEVRIFSTNELSEFSEV